MDFFKLPLHFSPLLQALRTMKALLSALWSHRRLVWRRREVVSYASTALLFILLLALSIAWYLGRVAHTNGTIALTLLHNPQLYEPCEVYTRTRLGDINVHKTSPPQAYVENTRLSNAIEEAMSNEPRVWVLYAPPDAGKSTAVTHVLHKLHQQGKANVLELRGTTFPAYYDSVGKESSLIFQDWLQHAMGCANPFSTDSSTDLGHVFPEQPRSVIFIDQFEVATNKVSDIKAVRDMMHMIAVDIGVRKNYAVLITTSNLETYLEILKWNGGRKFAEVVKGGFTWTLAELQMVVDTYQRKGFITPNTAPPPAMAALQQAMKNMTTINELRLYFESHASMINFDLATPEPERLEEEV